MSQCESQQPASACPPHPEGGLSWPFLEPAWGAVLPPTLGHLESWPWLQCLTPDSFSPEAPSAAHSWYSMVVSTRRLSWAVWPGGRQGRRVP